MYGMSHRIVSLTEAVQILGLQVLRALVLTIQVFDFYQKPSLKSELQKVWRHSADVAHLARKICDERKWSSEISEGAFLAALLHDIGRIILSATPPETRTQLFPEYQLHKEGMQCPASQAIEAEAGGYLLALWGVPDPIITAVRTYHTLSDGMGESSGVALAIAHQFLDGVDEEDVESLILHADGLAILVLAGKLRCHRGNIFSTETDVVTASILPVVADGIQFSQNI